MTEFDMKPRRVPAAKMERLADWSLRKPTIALMGEFSAGKSTLLNLLLGQDILPTQVTATRMPPVWLRYGTDPSYRVDKDGHKHPVDIKNPGTIPLKETRFLRVHVQSELLKNCDLMDTPGISDPNIPTDAWIRAIGYANAVLWCTHAGQAWRESERSAWEALPMRLRKTSLLLITRADKIVNDVDRDKIDRRMQRETAQLFDGRHFISLTNAMKAREENDAAGWTASGAEGFMESLNRIIEGVGIERSYLLSRYQVDESSTSSYVRPSRPRVDVMAPVAEPVPEPEVVAEPAFEPEVVAEEPAELVSFEDEVVAEAEVEVEPEIAVEAEPEVEPETVSLARPARIRPEGAPSIARPDRSAFDDRIAELNRLAAAEAAASLPEPTEDEQEDEPEFVVATAENEPEPEIYEPEGAEPTEDAPANLRALRDAFAADPVTDDAEDLVAETPVEPDWTSDDVAEVEVEAVFAVEAELEAEPEDEPEVVAFADETEVEPEPETEEPEAVADAASTTIYSPEPRPAPAPVAAAPAPAAPVAATGDAIDQLVSILSSAAAPTPIRPVAAPEPVAAAANSFSANEVDAIRDTWRDMQDRYNIAAMPRLAQAVTSLLEALTIEQRNAAAAAAAAAEQAASNVVPVTPAEPPANAAGGRRFVRGLF